MGTRHKQNEVGYRRDVRPLRRTDYCFRELARPYVVDAQPSGRCRVGQCGGGTLAMVNILITGDVRFVAGLGPTLRNGRQFTPFGGYAMERCLP